MAKSIINLTGIYSRWDILGLCVRENQYEPVYRLEESSNAGASGMVRIDSVEPREEKLLESKGRTIGQTERKKKR